MFRVVEPLGRGARADVVAAKALAAPAWFWCLWASAGWVTWWESRTVKRGQLAARRYCGAFPTRRSMGNWQRMWAGVVKASGSRTMTASEWSARTGEPIPDWLRS